MCDWTTAATLSPIVDDFLKSCLVQAQAAVTHVPGWSSGELISHWCTCSVMVPVLARQEP